MIYVRHAQTVSNEVTSVGGSRMAGVASSSQVPSSSLQSRQLDLHAWNLRPECYFCLPAGLWDFPVG